MKLSDLSIRAAGLFATTWTLHLNMISKSDSTDFLFWHKYFDELKDEAYETLDRIAESCLQHNEKPIISVTAPDFVNPSTYDAINYEMRTIEVLLDCLNNLDNYDIGVDNMIGDIYEKWSKQKDYFLRRSI